MSRLRIVILLVVVAAALPATADAAKLPSYCRLVSAHAVGKAAGYRGMRMSGRNSPFYATSGERGRGTICDYASAQNRIAEWSVGTLRSAKAAAAEFAGDIQTRRVDGSATPKRIKGPWDKAYITGDREVYALRGRHILNLAFWVPVSGPKVISLVKAAARKI